MNQREFARQLDDEVGDRVTLIRDPTQDNRDAFDRLLRYVERGDRDIGRRQVRQGWAKVFVFEIPFRRVGKYRKAQSRARADDRGVWDRCGGDFPGGSDSLANLRPACARCNRGRRDYWAGGRRFAYGEHPSPLRHAACTEWAAAMTVEVANSVGDALSAFRGRDFFRMNVLPLIESVEAVRRDRTSMPTRSARPRDPRKLIAAVSACDGLRCPN